ncbi:MAG: cation diffusion facilitator family transporter [Clostridia bacterium]|nr:cation diffusion facilitator family transporter [Clostridia bacterium]
MVTFLSRWLIADHDQTQDPAVRRKYGVLCGAVGIVINVLLFLGKFFAGTISGSIAITADAFNNLSDAGSSLVTILGFKLAGQKPDPDHPFGHGRMEYLSGLAVAMLILLMGIELLKSSVEKILHPEAIEFSWLSVGILLAAIACKLYMASYNRSVGKKIQSSAMKATATDSLSDSLATTAVLAATLIAHFFHVNIDGWVGLAVACFILYAGYNAARDTVSPLLGQAPDPELVRSIEQAVLAFDPIVSIHDMVVHDYGPGRMMISLHAEVPADGDLVELHDTIDLAEQALKEQFQCDAVIHMDPIVTNDETVLHMRAKMAQLVQIIDPRITIHDFRMVAGPTHTNLIFDAACPFDLHMTDGEVKRQIEQTVDLLDGNYMAVVTVDRIYASGRKQE